jgi:hypothetical protein
LLNVASVEKRSERTNSAKSTHSQRHLIASIAHQVCPGSDMRGTRESAFFTNQNLGRAPDGSDPPNSTRRNPAYWQSNLALHSRFKLFRTDWLPGPQDASQPCIQPPQPLPPGLLFSRLSNNRSQLAGETYRITTTLAELTDFIDDEMTDYKFHPLSYRHDARSSTQIEPHI